MDRKRIAELRALVEAEEMSWGDVADLQGEFEKIDPATLPEPAENAGWGDMLDEIENRLPNAVTITVTRSAGDDRAMLVMIDTDFEPDGSDGGPGLRVLLNDDEAYVGKAYDFGANHPAKSATWCVGLDDIPYVTDVSEEG
jgi:hypothetical protein